MRRRRRPAGGAGRPGAARDRPRRDMARTKASRLSQAGRRGVDAGVGDTTRTAREGAAFPPPAQEPSERGVPRMPGDALHLRLAPDPASDERGPRERRRRAGRALAPRRVRGVGGTASDATRAGSRPTHGQPSGRARCVRRSRARSARRPRRNPESRRRQRRAPCASRDTSTVRPTSARARAPAPTRPLRHPFQRVAFPRTRRGGDAALSVARRPAKNPARSAGRIISRARFPALRFFLIPASRASPWTGFRFTEAERALLVSVFERYEGKTPDRATCDAIARAFTRSPVRNPRRRVAAPSADEAPRAKHARAPANVLNPLLVPVRLSPRYDVSYSDGVGGARSYPERRRALDAPDLPASASPPRKPRRRRTRPTLRRGRRRRRFASRRRFESRRAPPSRRVGRRHHARLGVADVSAVWSDPTPAYPTPAIFDDDVEDGRARDDENTKREDENVPSASSDGGASGGGDEGTFAPARSSAKNEANAIRTPLSVRRRRRASRDRIPWRLFRSRSTTRRVATPPPSPNATSPSGNRRARVFTWARARTRSRLPGRDARPPPSPPPPPPEAATPVPYLPEQPNVLASEDSAAEVAAEMAAVARVSALAGGDAFARASRLRFDGANSRLDRRNRRRATKTTGREGSTRSRKGTTSNARSNCRTNCRTKMRRVSTYDRTRPG